MSDTTSSDSKSGKVYDDSDSKDSRAEKELKKCLRDYNKSEQLLKRRLQYTVDVI